MQLSPRLAARPLRLLPPLASATSGPRRHSVAYLIKPQAPPRPDSTPSTRPPHPPSNFPELSSEACRLFSDGEVRRRRSPSKSPEARTLRAAQVSVTFRRLAFQRSEDSVCPRVPPLYTSPFYRYGFSYNSNRLSLSPLEIRPTPRRPGSSGQSLPTILTVQAFGSFRRFPALAHRPSRD